MELDSRIYVAGHRGLVGSALVRELTGRGYKNLIVRTSAELDLREQEAVRTFFEDIKPEYVFLAAAKVGGIHANNRYRGEFLYDNLMIQTNVVHQSYVSGVRKLMFLGSSCIYPKHADQPMKEEALLTGALEHTNEPYAVAKIAGIKMCAAYNHQFGTDFISVMPTNLYGPNDNYDLQNSHVLPALIRKCHEAKEAGARSFVLWGTGKPKREFLFSDDLASACVFLMNRFTAAAIGELVNIGVGEDIAIRDLALLVADVVGFTGRLEHDLSKPDGTPRKLMDVSRLTNLGWRAETPLRQGIERAYEDYLAHVALVSA
jgi:GDP-L-fucose synthase